MSDTRWIPLEDWNKHHSFPLIWELEDFIFSGRRIGFQNVFKYAGPSFLEEKCFIDETAFFEWFEKLKKGNPAEDSEWMKRKGEK